MHFVFFQIKSAKQYDDDNNDGDPAQCSNRLDVFKSYLF